MFSPNQSAVLLWQITQLVHHPSNHNAITLSIYQLVSTNNCWKKYQLAKPWPCKSPTTQAALYALQMTQLV